MSGKSKINSFSTVTTSDEDKINASTITTSKECKMNSSMIETSKEYDVNSSTVAVCQEVKLNSSSRKECDSRSFIFSTIDEVAASEDSQIKSSTIPTSNEYKVSLPMIETSKESEDNSFTVTTSETCSVNTSTVTTSVEDNSSMTTRSNENEMTSKWSETASTSPSAKYTNIEEAVLKTIKYIEQEIESYEQADLKENDFQSIEMKIKTSNVMVAIEEAIEKLGIAFCLQWIFVENLYEIKELCGETNMTMMINEYCKIRDQDDIDVCRFRPMVINCISDAYAAGVGKFVDQHRHKLPEAEIEFLSTMVQFKYMAEWQMGMSAIKALNKDKTLHKMWTANEKMKAKINEMEIQLEDNRSKLKELVDEKNNAIAAHNKTISDLEKRNANEINAEIFKSNKAMKRVCATREEKQKILAADVEQIKETYEKLVQSNLIIEKTLRDQKSKTRQKLQSILTKYDNGVGERFAELMRIRNELDEETVLYENKVKEFQLQEIEYNQIMADKAEVEAKIREEKLIFFMMNRSARIIQRAYKKMMKKRKKGKKGKKGKKQKKKQSKHAKRTSSKSEFFK